MNEYIQTLATIDYVSFLLAFFTIAGAIVAGKTILEKFCDVVGIKLTYLEEKRKMQECQTTVKQELKDIVDRQDRFEKEHRENMEKREEFNKEILDAMQSLKNDIDILDKTIERREAEKQFKKLRYDILNFADRIVKSEQISAELIDQVFSEIILYHDMVEKYEFENGKVDVSIKVIQKKYQELLMSGKVIERMEKEI